MINWKSYPVRNLEGMQMSVSPLQIADGELRLICNYDPKIIGSLIKTTGYAQRGANVANVTDVMGLANFYYTDNRVQMAALDTGSAVDLYKFNPSTNAWVAQSQSLSSGFKVEMATYLDGLFATNYAEVPRFYDGSTWSTTTNLTTAPKAKYVVAYGDRLALLNCDVSGAAHSSRVQLSSLPDASYNITWDTSDNGTYFDYLPKDGDVITGGEYAFNRLFVFKEKHVGRYDGSTLYTLPGVPGTNNHRSIVTMLGWTLWFHTSGLYGTQGESGSKLSRSVDEIIEGVSSNNLGRICARRNGDYYEIFLYDINNIRTGLTIPKCLLKLDVAKMKFSYESLAHEPRIFSTYRDDRSDLTYDTLGSTYDNADVTYDGIVSAADFLNFGASNGKIYKCDSTLTTHDGMVIRSNFETYNYYFAGVPNYGQLQAVKAYVNKGRRIKLLYSIDDQPWRPITEYKEESGSIFYQFPKAVIANRIKFKGGDNSMGGKTQINGFDIFYTPQTEL